MTATLKRSVTSCSADHSDALAAINMISSLLILIHLIMLAAAGDKVYLDAQKGSNVTLPCAAVLKPDVEYYSCRWYKESVDPRLTGLASLALPDGEMRWYVGADTRISVDKSLNLHLPTITCSDEGVYQCYLAAPVGQQNREGRVQLNVEGCPREELKVPDDPVVALSPPNMSQLKVFTSLLLLSFILVSALFVFHLKRNRWTKPKKSVDLSLYPSLSTPLNKPGLFTTFLSNSPSCSNV